MIIIPHYYALLLSPTIIPYHSPIIHDMFSLPNLTLVGQLPEPPRVVAVALRGLVGHVGVLGIIGQPMLGCGPLMVVMMIYV